MKSSESMMVEVYRAKDLTEAHLIRGLLASVGVDAFIDGRCLQAGLGELSVGWSTAPRIVVEEPQARVARETVHRAQAQLRQRRDESAAADSQCLACRGSMSDEEASCAHCGWTFLEEIGD